VTGGNLAPREPMRRLPTVTDRTPASLDLRIRDRHQINHSASLVGNELPRLAVYRQIDPRRSRTAAVERDLAVHF